MIKKSDKSSKSRRRISANIASGKVHILSTFNNNIVTITDSQGAVVFSGSAGQFGFKGARKSTVHAAQVTASNVMKMAYEAGMRNADIIIRGIGMGKEIAVRTIGLSGINILSIRYNISIPHNGARPKKTRRV